MPLIASAQSNDPGPPEAESEGRGLGFFSGSYEPAEFSEPRFELETFVWYVSPGGDVGFADTELVGTADLSIDDPRLAPGAELHYRQGPWRFSLLGAITSQHGGSVAESAFDFGSLSVAPGDTLVTEIDLDTYALSVGYRLWAFAADGDDHGAPRLQSSVEAVAGLRAYDYGLSVDRITGPSGSESGDLFQIEPIVGFKWMIEFDDTFSVDLATSFGYLPEISGQSSSSLDITAGFRYAPTPNIAAQIGYRLLVFDLASDDVEAEGALAGLIGGIVLSF